MASSSNEKEGLNNYAIIEACEEESIDMASMGKGSIGKGSIGKESVDKGSSINKEKISSVQEEETEVGKEADGYLSDASTVSSESGIILIFYKHL